MSEVVEVPKALLNRAFDRIEEQSEEIENLRNHNEQIAKDLAKANQRIEKLEQTTKPESDESAESNDAEEDRSPLAQLIDVPLERAKEQLTANQERARTVAQRAIELGKKVKAGLVIKSEDIAEHLEERGVDPHTETIRRVMDYLADLGKSDVEDTMHKGDRLLVFDPERVQEYGNGETPERISTQRDVIRLRESGSPPPTA